MANFRFVSNCGEYIRTIFSLDGGKTIHIGCSLYTPENAIRSIEEHYENHELKDSYIQAVRYISSDDYVLDMEKFDWKRYSWVIAKHASQLLDPEKYNWKRHSWRVAEHCSDKLDPERYNWKNDSWAIARYCPDKLDPERYNWEEDSDTVEKCCPELLKHKKG